MQVIETEDSIRLQVFVLALVIVGIAATHIAADTVKHPAQTPLEYAIISHQYHTPAIAEVIDDICQAYISWRYGGQSSNLNQLRQRRQQISN